LKKEVYSVVPRQTVMTSGPNVAIVVLDTLRRDTFERYFEWVPGISFENAYSTSHWTIPAHASLLTGRYASEVGVHGKSRDFDCPDRSVVEALHDDGYTTRTWMANPQVATWDGWDRGFDEFLAPRKIRPDADDSLDWQAFYQNTSRSRLTYLRALGHAITSSSPTIPSLRYGFHISRRNVADGGAGAVLERARRTDFGNEEFLLVNLMDAHAPHYPPKPFRTVDEQVNFLIGDAFADRITDPDRNRRAYDDSAAYLSATYREIFRELRRDFEYVITLSDHGEMLGENGMWNHGYGLYPELTHVPLVVSGDGIGDETRTDVASVLDVPETVATIAGIDFEGHGKKLLGDDRSAERLVEYHGFLPWHEDQLKRKGVPDVFDRFDGPLRGFVTSDGKYVFETHEEGPVSPAGPVRSDEIERLEALVSDLSERTTEADTSEVSPAVRSRLEELGYA
jgi:arylsulfatase